MTAHQTLPGWDELSHSGLLLDAARLGELARHAPPPLDDHTEARLRQRATGILDDAESAEAARFVAFVLDEVCGFDAATGAWQRGSNVPATEGRKLVTGERRSLGCCGRARAALAWRCSSTNPPASALAEAAAP